MILGFQFGLGTIPWIYVAETCNDRAASVCAITNFLSCLIVVVVAPYLYSAVNGYIWLIYATIIAFSLTFVCIFMKETKGLSEEEVKKLYRVNSGHSGSQVEDGSKARQQQLIEPGRIESDTQEINR